MIPSLVALVSGDMERVDVYVPGRDRAAARVSSRVRRFAGFDPWLSGMYDVTDVRSGGGG